MTSLILQASRSSKCIGQSASRIFERVAGTEYDSIDRIGYMYIGMQKEGAYAQWPVSFDLLLLSLVYMQWPVSFDLLLLSLVYMQCTTGRLYAILIVDLNRWVIWISSGLTWTAARL